jgi:hypothetical protein
VCKRFDLSHVVSDVRLLACTPLYQSYGEANMSASVSAGVIRASDIEELNKAVFPWELRMSQIGRGNFEAELNYPEIGGIFLTYEKWSRSVSDGNSENRLR